MLFVKKQQHKQNEVEVQFSFRAAWYDWWIRLRKSESSSNRRMRAHFSASLLIGDCDIPSSSDTLRLLLLDEEKLFRSLRFDTNAAG